MNRKMISWTKEEEEILKLNYPSKSREILLELLNGRTWRAIRDHSLGLGLTRSKEAVDSDRAKHLKEHLGVTSTWQLESVKSQSRKTNIERRGVEYPSQSAKVREKVRETVQERYGVDNVFQSEEVKTRLTQTNIEKYGVPHPLQNEEIHEKVIATNMERYGIENTFQLTDRVQQGMIRNHGDSCPLRVPEIKERQQQTNIKNFGFKTPAESPEIQEKIEATNMIRYGFKTPFLNPTVKQMIRETNIRKYGVTNPAKVEEIKRRIQETTFKRHGVKSFLEIKEIREKAYTVRKNRKCIYKSKEEIDFLEYLKIIDPDTEPHVENPATKNIIDYYMPKFDLWVQYDGAYWHGKIKRFNVTRQSLKIQRTIKRDQYQNDNIPNLIRFWSDDAQKAIENNSVMDLIENKIIEKTFFSHQYLKKMETLQEDKEDLDFDPEKISASDFILSPENISTEITEFITRYEWLGTTGVIPKWCFTARYQGKLGGVVFINEPTAYSQLLGEGTKKLEALIQRGATVSWSPKNLGSRLVMYSCNWMTQNTDKRLFVGYADPMANELGTIYQACNFDYLGNNFGVSFLFKHPQIKNGKWFSAQTLKRTSSFKKWCSKNDIIPLKSWFKDNGFKDLKSIPEDIKKNWYAWNRQIIKESERLKVDKKHKYAIIIGKDKREQGLLLSLQSYTPQPYPKRVD